MARKQDKVDLSLKVDTMKESFLMASSTAKESTIFRILGSCMKVSSRTITWMVKGL